MIVAKFKCESVAKPSESNGDTESISLSAVYGPGNETWSKFTPSGSLSMSISNPAAQGKFQPGKSYLLNISEAE